MFHSIRKIIGPGGYIYLWLPIKNIMFGEKVILCPEYDGFSTLTLPGWLGSPTYYTDEEEKKVKLRNRLYFNQIGNPFLIIPSDKIFNLKIAGLSAFYSFKSHSVEFLSESVLFNFEKAPEKFLIEC